MLVWLKQIKMEQKKGLVIKSTGSLYLLRIEGEGEVFAKIGGRLRVKNIRNTNPVAVGDIVLTEKREDYALIIRVLARKNYIIRKATNLSKENHILAANIDQALLLITLKHPATSTLFIDRFLTSAEAYRIPVILIFNKIDLLSQEETQELENLMEIYRKIGYSCYATSAQSQTGVHFIKELLKNKVSVVAGLSGVGKSTLINAIDSRWSLKTGEISAAHQSGKHTTTFAEMFELNSGGYIIDTPGVRGFGLVDISKSELGHYFKEIFLFSQQCKYNNCYHVHEPNCAVREAVAIGKISQSRYENYLKLFLDEDTKHR